jgi:hypothetical protein
MQSRRDTLPEGVLLGDALSEERDSRVDPAELQPNAASEQRVTISSLPTSLEPSSSSPTTQTISSLPTSTEAVTGRRPRAGLADTWKSATGDELPARSIERLLVLWTELPVAAGDRAVTRAVVDAIASLLPDALVGACLVPASGGRQEIIRA